MTDDRMKQLLQAAMPPVREEQLHRDLWPQLRGRLDQTPMRVSRLDWALLAAAIAWIVVFPESFLVLVFHL